MHSVQSLPSIQQKEKKKSFVGRHQIDNLKAYQALKQNNTNTHPTVEVFFFFSDFLQGKKKKRSRISRSTLNRKKEEKRNDRL